VWYHEYFLPNHGGRATTWGGPDGWSGKPVYKRDYFAIQVKGLKLLIEKTLVDDLAETSGRINVRMGDYGSRAITLE